jgi:hypothetical protein
MLKVMLACLATLVLTACPSTNCKPKMARCQDGVIQLCRPDKKWQQVVDCKKIDKAGPWSCACTDPQTCRCKKPAK